jgi:hypothetical protein
MTKAQYKNFHIKRPEDKKGKSAIQVSCALADHYNKGANTFMSDDS